MQSPVVSDPSKGEWKPAEGSVLCLLEWMVLSSGAVVGQSVWEAGIRHRACAPRRHQPGHKLQVVTFQDDPVCYLKKAFLLVQDIMEDTMRFKDNTPNAKAIVQLQELSLRLKSCFTMDYDEQDKVGGPWSWGH